MATSVACRQGRSKACWNIESNDVLHYLGGKQVDSPRSASGTKRGHTAAVADANIKFPKPAQCCLAYNYESGPNETKLRNFLRIMKNGHIIPSSTYFGVSRLQP